MLKPFSLVPRFSWKRWLGISLVLIGIPILLAIAAVSGFAKDAAAARRKAIEEELDQTLARQELGANPVEFHTHLLQKFESHLFSRKKFSNPVAERAVQNLKLRFPGVFTFTFLDGQGRARPGLCDGPAPRALLQRFFLSYQSSNEHLPNDLQSQRSFLMSFFGPMFPSGGDWSEKVIQIRSNPSKQYMYMSRPNPLGMFIVHLTRTESWNRLPLEDLVKSYNGKKHSIKLILRDRQNPLESELVSMAGNHGTTTALDEYERDSIGFLWESNTVQAGRLLTSNLGLVAQARLPFESREGKTWRNWTRGLLFLWLFLSLGCFMVMNGIPPLVISVKWTLILAFSYAAGIPLLAMGLTAKDFLSHRRQVLEDRLHQSTERVLRGFDGKFPQTIQELERNMQKLFLRLTHSTTMDGKGLGKFLCRWRKRFHWGILDLIDSEGKVVFEDAPGGSRLSSPDDLNIYNKIAGSLIKSIQPDQAIAKKQNAPRDQLDLLVARVKNSLGSINLYDLSIGQFLLAIHPQFRSDGRPDYMASFIWFKEALEQQYLDSNILALARTLDDTTIFAYNNWNPELIRPNRSSSTERWRKFSETIRSADQVGQTRVITGDEVHLVTGIRCRELERYRLVAVSGDRFIRQEISGIAWQYAAAGFVVLLISGAVGAFLAQAFLTPILHLSQGVEALENRRFSHRLPILSIDDFGMLAQAFNQMLESLADLEVARIVQEQLFPRTTLKVGNWSIFGRCVPATQVGGDYFDYFPLDNDRVMIIIGDVSGHGVPAALVMAMAKAIIGHPSRPENPAALLATMNVVLIGVLKRQGFMTCIAAVLDVKNQTLETSNAGHPYPVIVRPFGIEEKEIRSRPLGIQKLLQPPTVSIPVLNERVVFLYSDGLIEAPISAEEHIGFERLAGRLPNLVGESATETVRQIGAWHHQLAPWDNPADDVTILVLQRGPTG